MKKIFLIAILAFSMNAFAQVSKTVNCTVGSLSTTLTASEKSTITSLTITGSIDARDFKTMRDDMPLLAELDLSEVTILAYQGTEGTYSVTSYPANAMPSDSFYDYINFRGKTSLTHIILPNSITSVDNYAFYGCSGLTTINIPSLVTTLGVRAIPRNCSVTVALDNPNLILVDGVIYNKDQSNIILFLDSKTGSYAMPASVVTISDGAFSDYTGLTSIILPNGLTSIGISAFRGCTRLTSINFPEGLNSIGSAAFSGCMGLTSINVPSSVINLGDGAFIGCMNITSISLHEGLTSIGISAFSGCTGLTSIIVPASIITLGNGAFYGCINLTSISLLEGLNSIGISAFSGCTGLTSINVPSSVITLGNGAFSGYISLTSISLHEGLTSIGISAFQDCTRLTSITIPSSVTVLSDGAFYNCMGLTSIYTYATMPINIDASVFYNVNKATCTLYVPKGSRYLYSVAYQWNEFANIVELPELSLSADAVKIDAATGSTAFVDISSDAEWKASSNESWLTVSPGSGNGTGKLTFTATANTSNTIRNAIVTVSATGVKSRTISVVQSYNLQSKITKLYDFDCQYPYSFSYDSRLVYNGIYIYEIMQDMAIDPKCKLIRIKPDGSEFEVLYSFNFIGNVSLILSGNVLYGTVQDYDSSNFLFQINTDGTSYKKLDFLNGIVVVQNSLVISGNRIYGSSVEDNNGYAFNLFKVNTDGTEYAVVYSSDYSNQFRNLILSGNTLIGDHFGKIMKVNIDGSDFLDFNIYSDIPVLVDKNIIYGMKSAIEGTEGYIFKINLDGTGFKKIKSITYPDFGSSPIGALSIIGNTLYGMTEGNAGIFKINTDGSGFTRIQHDIQLSQYSISAVLTQVDSELYGFSGSDGISGSIFKINTLDDTVSKVFEFGTSNFGMIPMSTLIESKNFLYGCIAFGGNFGKGTIFRINKDGSNYIKLFEFKDSETGIYPKGQLTLIENTLYGTTIGDDYFGEANPSTDQGCIFKINTDGTEYKFMHKFNRTDGKGPIGSLVFYNGDLYGNTYTGGTDGHGVIYRIKPDGSQFTKVLDYSSNDTGERSENGIIISDGVIYGVSSIDYGGVFSVNTDGTGLKKIFEMNAATGDFSYSKPLLINDKLYVTTSEGGEYGVGTIFKIKTDGTGLTVLYNFEGIDESEDSGFRNNSLMYYDGALYGTATGNGINNHGYLYMINLDGTGFTKLSDFNGEYGSQPYLCDLIIDNNADIYGMTTFGGKYSGGIIYKYSLNETSISKRENNENSKVFPNPAHSTLFVTGLDQNSTALIFDMSGKTLINKSIIGNQIDIKDLPNGIYFLRISGNSRISTAKFVKQ